MSDVQCEDFNRMMASVIDAESELSVLREMAKKQAGRITELQMELADKNRLLNIDLSIEELNDTISKLLDVHHQKFMATVGSAMVDGLGVGNMESFFEALTENENLIRTFSKTVEHRRTVLTAINDRRDDRPL